MSAEPVVSVHDVAFRLGLWLSGLQSFLQIRNYSFAEGNRAKASVRDWTKEFQLTNSTLLLCSKLALELLRTLEEQGNLTGREAEADFQNSFSAQHPAYDFSFEEISLLSIILKNSILLNEALLRSTPLQFSEWTAWSNDLSAKLKQVAVVNRIIHDAEREGEKFLPELLHELLQTRPIPFAMESDLRIVLPRIAKILKWLSVVGEMLQKDEPLKPALLLFSRVYEQMREMMSYINNRLLRFSNEQDPVFEALDCAVYAASVELRKVYSFELAGLSEVRQAPLVYAKIETAYSLLNDSFQQTLVNFAQIIDPEIDPRKLFPTFQTKLEQSLALRRELWNIQQAVQKAERNPDSYAPAQLHKRLADFVKGSMRYLMYKDCETVERFVEEVMRTSSPGDLTPILHRFGAYLETLFGQVNMRTVLAKHPFDFPKE